jgi:hypothetical protein
VDKINKMDEIDLMDYIVRKDAMDKTDDDPDTLSGIPQKQTMTSLPALSITLRSYLSIRNK